MPKDTQHREAANELNPQRALWQAVLVQAVEDAIRGASISRNDNARTYRITATKAARAWLTTPSQDLATVCHLAGLDPQAVMERMRKQLADAPSPEELVSRPKLPRPKRTPKPRMQRASSHYTLSGETLHVSEWAARAGVSVAAIRSRISAGWPLEAALTATNQEGARRARAAANSGWAYLTAKARAKAEANPEPAARPRRKGAATLTYEGRTLTYSEWAERTGIPMRTIRTRVAKDWPVERILDPSNPRRKAQGAAE